ncbi:unannotated protein [freshwater metagenome]|jgi:hypothetical protein|uniref:Unannotated protein n=1 Tax=freshwater metagenome TaxID=449393 RepID=A0A6J7FJ12_9ZZZZ|nr:nuclear transport factor 2 family protein [Acidimicrobiia bacterium]MCX6503790.1 nuclear transport factor 2 family protein [Actinomycetota bacterium]MSV40105.1 nuclear transport factor 2 family protein [Actinomycetota bacterium]MSV93814.1 nuclear transport factor 2 family protein [Actinomycetota bacterium]MSW60337.1 nuclear transport factor 2 family protein [Actinomycetota bacterium]
MGKYSRAEIEEAFAKFQATAAEAGVTGDWRAWSECFTEDVEYYEHHYGRMHGRAQVLDWINTTMAESINKDMSSFPIAWTMIDEDKGWIMCQVDNVMDDPGDGSDHREYNWTLLHYAGNGQFSYEEDMYNPTEFGLMIKGWIKARRAASPPRQSP